MEKRDAEGCVYGRKSISNVTYGLVYRLLSNFHSARPAVCATVELRRSSSSSSSRIHYRKYRLVPRTRKHPSPRSPGRIYSWIKKHRDHDDRLGSRCIRENENQQISFISKSWRECALDVSDKSAKASEPTYNLILQGLRWVILLSPGS